MKKLKIANYILWLFLSLIAFESFSKGTVVLKNQILDKNIRTVQFYHSGGVGGDQIEHPFVPKNSPSPLILEFDWLGDELPYMQAKIVHCDYNWSKSTLMEMEYLDVVNKFLVDDVQSSSNTFVPFYHISFDVPQTRISGNFLLVIFDQDNEERIFLTRRFVVYEQEVIIKGIVNFSNVIALRDFNHQMDFEVTYTDYEILDPRSTTNVSILQNGRWDNAIYNLKPSIMEEHNKFLKYDFITGENNFTAGNEFRIFETRNIKTGGVGIKDVNRDTVPRIFELYEDLPLRDYAYTNRIDINGKFVVQNFVGNDDLNSDYVKVKFRLKTAQLPEDVYIFGQLSDWKLDLNYAMEYNAETKCYQKELLLKQGHYNYLYAINKNETINTDFLEGSHKQTQNEYFILVYHRAFGEYYDKVVGFSLLK